MILEDAHALAVGVSRYQHIRPLPDVMDAEDVAAVLADPRHGAYPPGHVALLRDGEATRAAILDRLDALAARTGPRSSVFLYFSGHGGQLTGAAPECYLMPVDAADEGADDLARTAISGRELSDRLRAIPAARVTVVLDCCRAAGLAEPKDVRPLRLEPSLSADALSPLARGRGRAVLAASTRDGDAIVWRGQRNGVFTRHLLDGLRGGATGTGGVIRLFDLYHFVQQRVAAEPGGQRPVFKADLEENYPVAFHRGGQAPPLEIRPPTGGFRWDAFVSYRREDPLDRAWVEGALVPRLERYGLAICLRHRDFRLGHPVLREMERAVEESRYTVAVLTPAYLDGAFEERETLLARHRDLEGRSHGFLPLFRRSCRPSLGIRAVAALDLADDASFEVDVQRLAQALREPPERD
jgi:hypothetical protein